MRCRAPLVGWEGDIGTISHACARQTGRGDADTVANPHKFISGE
jgi:hypothetical protein